MTGYPYQPEWHQNTDRSSPLADPVITVRQLSRFELAGRRLPGRIDHAFVFATQRGAYETSLPPHRPGFLRRRGAGYTAVYEVDLGLHPLHVDLTLPSLQDAFQFSASVDITWQVAVPDRVVATNLRDVPALLGRLVEQRMRCISRRYDIADSADAELALQKDLSDGPPLADATGLSVTCSVRLSADDRALAHQERLRELRYGMAEAVPEQRYELLRARHEQERLAEKAQFYRDQLAGDGVSQWAMQLAGPPEEVTDALKQLREEQRAVVEKQLELVKEILTENGMEKYQADEVKSRATRLIQDFLDQVETPGTGVLPLEAPLHDGPVHPALSEEEAGR